MNKKINIILEILWFILSIICAILFFVLNEDVYLCLFIGGIAISKACSNTVAIINLEEKKKNK